jgi:uncharacterized protein
LGVRIEYFGTGTHLLGAFHLAQRLQPRRTAVLLCSPFGEEASRAHRTYRVLATQLERAGFSVLRFDYSGTGDSLGQAEDVTLATCVADIGAAAEGLLAASGAQRVALVGLRLGATLALLASTRGLRPRHLLLWDPIVDGAAYLRELVTQHREYMRDEMGHNWQDRLLMRSDGTPREAFGAPISDALAAELCAIDLATVTPSADALTVITTRPPDPARLPSQAKWIEIRESTAWNSDAALNSTIVPIEVVQAIVSQLEHSP